MKVNWIKTQKVCFVTLLHSSFNEFLFQICFFIEKQRKQYQCESCRYSSESQDDLNIHKKTKHEGLWTLK